MSFLDSMRNIFEARLCPAKYRQGGADAPAGPAQNTLVSGKLQFEGRLPKNQAIFLILV